MGVCLPKRGERTQREWSRSWTASSLTEPSTSFNIFNLTWELSGAMAGNELLGDKRIARGGSEEIGSAHCE